MIDNSKYYNDCLAYDFEMFTEHPKRDRSQNNIIKMKPKVRPKTKIRSNILVKMSIIASVLFFCFANIQLRIVTNEINSEINQKKVEIRELEAEKKALEMQLENMISLEMLETRALEMGMRKMEKDQIKYIRTVTEDKATQGEEKNVIE